MAALVNGCYAMVPIPDPSLGPRHVDVATHVQHRALPAELRQQDRAADLPDAGLMFWKKRVFGEVRAARRLREIVRHFNEAAADEETFSVHHRSAHLSRPADSGIFRRSERQARSGCRLRQGPVRARAARSVTRGASLVAFDLAEAMLRVRARRHCSRARDR